MTCVKAESHVQCMYYIDQAGKGEAVGADVVVLDAGDIYRSVSRNLACSHATSQHHAALPQPEIQHSLGWVGGTGGNQ